MSDRAASGLPDASAPWWPVVAVVGSWLVFVGPVGPAALDPFSEDRLLRVITAAGAAVFLAGTALRLASASIVCRQALRQAAKRWLAIFVTLTVAAWLLELGDLRVAGVVGAALAAADPPYPALSHRTEAAQATVGAAGWVQAVLGSTLSVVAVATITATVASAPSGLALPAVPMAVGVGVVLGGGVGWLLRFAPADLDHGDLVVAVVALVAYGSGTWPTGIGLLAAVCAGTTLGLLVRERDAAATVGRSGLQWFFVVGLLATLGGVLAGVRLREAVLPLLVLMFVLPWLLTAGRRLAWAPPPTAGHGLVAAAAAPGVVALYLAALATAAGLPLPPAAWATIAMGAALGVVARAAAATVGQHRGSAPGAVS